MAWSNEVFAKNLQMYMDINDMNQKELAEMVGVSAPTVHDWLKARKYPRIDKIEIIAHHFGILKSDLIEEHLDGETSKKIDATFPNFSPNTPQYIPKISPPLFK